MNGAEREPNCWLRIRGGPSDGKWYRAYLAPSAIPVAVKRGKARYLRVNPPAPEERYDPSSVEEDPAPLPIGVTDWETYSVRDLREMAKDLQLGRAYGTPKAQLVLALQKWEIDQKLSAE